MPFIVEGTKRMQIAEEGIERLKSNADAVIVVPNQRLLEIIDQRTSVGEAFKESDDILRQAVQGISDLINYPGEVNVDFADVRSIMSNAGTALMGMGKSNGTGADKARQAALMAIESPLLEMSIDGARGVLFNVQGGKGLTMHEISEAANVINEHVDKDAKIIFGTSIDPNFQDEIRITVVATGFVKEREEIINTGPKYTNIQNQQVASYQNQSNYQTSTSSSYTAPRFTRENRAETQPQTQKSEGDKLDKLDIPAFLRKKIDLDE